VHPLLAGSPAIDTGSDADCPAEDQLGTPRPVDGDGDTIATCDRGAVEFVPEPSTPLVLLGALAGAVAAARARRPGSCATQTPRTTASSNA
jgi:hypothetical protein